MSDIKFINLDPLAEEPLEIQIGGKKYKVQYASVVAIVRLWKKLNSNDPMEQIDASLELLYALSPEAATDKAFDTLTMSQLETLIKEVSGKVQGQHAVIGDKPVDNSKKKSTSESPSQNS